MSGRNWKDIEGYIINITLNPWDKIKKPRNWLEEIIIKNFIKKENRSVNLSTQPSMNMCPSGENKRSVNLSSNRDPSSWTKGTFPLLKNFKERQVFFNASIIFSMMGTGIVFPPCNSNNFSLESNITHSANTLFTKLI